jgi:hypothetical protein
LESLRERYPQAVDQVVDLESVELGVAVNPAMLRRHIFDFEEGIRMAVTREDQGVRGVFLHCSVSFREEFPDDEIDKGGGHLVRVAKERFRAISGDRRDFTLELVTEAGILHWFIQENRLPSYDIGTVEFTV